MRLHQGKPLLDADGSPILGPWEPLLDQATFDRLELLRRSRTHRGGSRRAGRVYLLSGGLLACGICGHQMSGMRVNATVYNYYCSRAPLERDHTLTASGRALDRIVQARAAVLLEDGVGGIDTPGWPHESELDDLRAELALAMARTRDRSSKIPADMLWEHVEQISGDVERLTAQRTAWETDNAIVAEAGGLSACTPEQFLAMENEEKRPYIRAMVGRIVIDPATRAQGSRFDESRVRFVPFRADGPA